MTDNVPPDWLEKMARHEPEGLSAAFAEYRPRLERIAGFRINPQLLTRIDVEDVLQETYLAAVKRIGHCDCSTSESVFVWLRLVLQQTIVDLHRKHLQAAGRDVQREIRADRTDPGTSGCIASHLVSRVSSPSMSLKREEMNDRLLLALSRMENTDREVLALRHFEELSNSEVAQILELSIKAASIRYVRAMKKLKTMLEEFSDMNQPF